MLDMLAGSHLERMPTNTVFLDILASHIRYTREGEKIALLLPAG